MNVRRLISSALAIFAVIVVLAFGYGFTLLLRTGFRSHATGSKSNAPRLSAADVQALLTQARQTARAGRVEQALVTYRRILADVPSVEAQLGLAEAELEAGREDVAVREFERVLDQDEGNATALARLARLYAADRNSWPQAEDRYRRYVALRPQDADALLALARLLAWREKPAEAVELFSGETVQTRMSFDDQRTYALALIAAGGTEDGERRVRKLLGMRPDDDELLAQLAGLHASRQEWKVAVPIYRALVQRRPADARLQLSYGHGLMALDDAPSAVEPLGKAARSLPQDAEAALAYARALRAIEDDQAASREFERVLSLRPRDAGVAREYGDLLMQNRDYRGAEKRYRHAFEHGLRDVRLLSGLAGALQANGKPEEAVPILEQAYSLQDTDRLAFELARLYERVGRPRDASRMLRKLESQSGRSSRQ